jgi:hypothetical protein
VKKKFLLQIEAKSYDDFFSTMQNSILMFFQKRLPFQKK